LNHKKKTRRFGGLASCHQVRQGWECVHK